MPTPVKFLNALVAQPFDRYTTPVADNSDPEDLVRALTGPCADYDWSGVACTVNTHSQPVTGNYIEATRDSNSCFCPTLIATSLGGDSTWALADHCGLYGSGEEFGGDLVRFASGDGGYDEVPVDNVYHVGRVYLFELGYAPSDALFARYPICTNAADLGGRWWWTQKHEGTGQLYKFADPYAGGVIAMDGVNDPTSPITAEVLSASGRPCFMPLAGGGMAIVGFQGPNAQTLQTYDAAWIADLEAVMGATTINTVTLSPANLPAVPPHLRRRSFSGASLGISLA